MKTLISAALLATLLTLTACTSGPVVRTDPTDPSRATLSLDQADVNATASAMVDSMLASPAVARVADVNNPPTIVVLPIRLDVNTITDPRINTDAITTLVRGQVINSGIFQFVDATRRADIAAELAYQHESGMVRSDTAAQRGQQIGANLILEGTLSGFASDTNRTRQRGYVITMTLQNLETGIILWQQTEQVQKLQQRRTIGF
ncbi:MAG: penicillin-binding protein activator LpoB [Verrucomicrobia bacterium]|nr:penicillin-binding protein activator LpoB [Verrucomicrobiota bacterium]